MADTKKEDADQASIALLEKSIQDNSPEFLSELESISELGSEGEIELVDIDEIIARQKANSLKARARRLWIKISQLSLKVFHFVRTQLIIFGKETLPYFIKTLVAGLKSAGESFGKGIGKFKTFSKMQKLAMVLILLGVGVFCYLLLRLVTTGLIKEDEKLFIRSMDEVSTQRVIFKTEDVEDFYNSPRVSQNIMSLRRIVVNIRKSKNSGSNPMGAFEFFLQGNSSDVMVEIRDREAQLTDMFQGVIRDFSYDELDTVQGKKRMLERLTRLINEELTKGKITQIYYKNFVLKK